MSNLVAKIYIQHLIFIIAVFNPMPFIYSQPKTLVLNVSKGNLSGQNEMAGRRTDPIVFDDFELSKGLEIMDLKKGRFFERRRIIQLTRASKSGNADEYFFDQSAKYDITLIYFDSFQERSRVDININGRRIGSIKFGESDGFQQQTISGINVQQWSKISLTFNGGTKERCRIEKLIFLPIGTFDGEVVPLEKPKTLKVLEGSIERGIGRRMFSDFVKVHTDSLGNILNSELTGLKTPEEWREIQKKIRGKLSDFFGEFPERTPLKAKTVGKVERKLYTIEKVIFESQPNYYVTANLYIPKGRKFPLPGVVFPCGHSDDAKARDVYHMSGLGLALKGYVALVFDPMGQGERSEYLDSKTKEPLVPKGVEQHWYVARPAYLVNWTLSGLRTWDCIRAVDYLISRPEVNKDSLAAVGCSGGGQMAMLITAVDERIKVCVASHPGGPMENSYLLGQHLVDREIYSLIPPRPIRIIVGNASLEEPGHRKKIENMQPFYDGLKFGRQTADLDVVPGVHSMNRSNRESAYEWLNKWFDKEAEGKAEPLLDPEEIKTLWCTESGSTIASLGGETGQSLNVKRAEKIYKPEKNPSTLKERVRKRIGLILSQDDHVPSRTWDMLSFGDISVEKLTYESEKGIFVPSLLIKPKNIKPGSPIYIIASDTGKPVKFENSNLAFSLAKKGFIVFAIDVRGIGETSPTAKYFANKFTGYTPLLGKHDNLAIQSLSFGRTTLGMNTLDLIKGVDFLKSRTDLKERKIVTVGEGLGGLWALLASIYDPRIDGTVMVGTLPSYKLLITNRYYNVKRVGGYFWVPGALLDFDIPDLVRLASPKPQVWIDPINELGEKLDFSTCSAILGSNKDINIITPDNKKAKNILDPFITNFNKN
jgi:cephalosporin-C deacetylase-like acetyl esterase